MAAANPTAEGVATGPHFVDHRSSVNATNRLARLMSDKRLMRTALLLALWVPAVIVLIVVREVLLPFVLALVFAYVLAPLVRRLSEMDLRFGRLRGKHLPRWASVLLVYVVLGLGLYLFGSIFIPQVYREATKLAKDASEFLNSLDDEHIKKIGDDLEEFFNRYNLPVRIITPGDVDDGVSKSGVIAINLVEVAQTIIRDIKAELGAETKALLSSVQAVIAGTIAVVFKTFLVLMLTAFIAADADSIVEFFFSLAPVRDHAKLRDLVGRIDRGLSSVIRGQLSICLINGLLTFVGLWLLKINFAFLLGTLAAIFSLVPIFGSIISTIPIVLVALPSGVERTLLAVAWIVAIHFLQHFLNAKIMGAAAKIHPVLIILALIVGEKYYGIVGALLAVPLMSILATIFRAARARAMQLDEEVAVQQETAAESPGPVPKRRPRVTREHPSS
jgi:predicted PurR-regulated permease PerM